MLKIFGITCDEATAICDKSQYGEATFKEKVQLNIHLLICKICKLYSKQNSFLTRIYKGKATECRHKKYTLSELDKTALKEKMKEFN